jgi:serralysin
MSCICNNQGLKSFKTRGKISLPVSSENAYPNGNSLSSIIEDVTYGEDNNFINGILWGAKWTNLDETKGLTWVINWEYGSSIPEEYNYLLEPTSETISALETCMTDLGNLIQTPVTRITDPDDAVISFNFIDNSLEEVNYLGFAMPPPHSDEADYTTYKDATTLKENLYAPGNIYIAYNRSMNFQKGSFNYITIVHELGHALGLAHPHDTGGTSSIYEGVTSDFGSFGTYNANQQPYTIMTYNDLSSANVPNSGETSGFLANFGPIDVVALQFLYGANTNYKPEDNTYEMPIDQSSSYWTTIWDAGGVDTISAVNSTANVVINLQSATVAPDTTNAGVSLSLSSGLFGGFMIAKGSTIENAIGGSGSDTIIGNSEDNTIDITKGGNDIVDAKGGYDTVIVGKTRASFSITINSSTEIALNDGTNSITLRNCEKIQFSDQTVTTENLIAEFSTSFKYGAFQLRDTDATQITYIDNTTFSDPVVICGDPTYKDAEYVITRLSNISSSNFSARFVKQSQNGNDLHSNETIPYFVAENNSVLNIGSMKIVISKIDINNKTPNFTSVDLSSYGFSEAPTILAQIQTENQSENPCVNLRTTNITKDGFEIAMQEDEYTANEVTETTRATETIGFMAISKGNASLDDKTFIAGTFENQNFNPAILYFTDILSETDSPLVLTKISSYLDSNPCTYRVLASSGKAVCGFIQEETSYDSETVHTKDNIDYFVINN